MEEDEVEAQHRERKSKSQHEVKPPPNTHLRQYGRV